jgi:hypothetical protein
MLTSQKSPPSEQTETLLFALTNAMISLSPFGELTVHPPRILDNSQFRNVDVRLIEWRAVPDSEAPAVWCGQNEKTNSL